MIINSKKFIEERKRKILKQNEDSLKIYESICVKINKKLLEAQDDKIIIDLMNYKINEFIIEKLSKELEINGYEYKFNMFHLNENNNIMPTKVYIWIKKTELEKFIEEKSKQKSKQNE